MTTLDPDALDDVVRHLHRCADDLAARPSTPAPDTGPSTGATALLLTALSDRTLALADELDALARALDDVRWSLTGTDDEAAAALLRLADGPWAP